MFKFFLNFLVIFFKILQKSKLIRGATTHENSATMILYGYGLTWYVVEASLAYQSMDRVGWTPYRSAWLGSSG
jgi:hypothetical protein